MVSFCNTFVLYFSINVSLYFCYASLCDQSSEVCYRKPLAKHLTIHRQRVYGILFTNYAELSHVFSIRSHLIRVYGVCIIHAIHPVIYLSNPTTRIFEYMVKQLFYSETRKLSFIMVLCSSHVGGVVLSKNNYQDYQHIA